MPTRCQTLKRSDAKKKNTTSTLKNKTIKQGSEQNKAGRQDTDKQDKHDKHDRHTTTHDTTAESQSLSPDQSNTTDTTTKPDTKREETRSQTQRDGQTRQTRRTNNNTRHQSREPKPLTLSGTPSRPRASDRRCLSSTCPPRNQTRAKTLSGPESNRRRTRPRQSVQRTRRVVLSLAAPSALASTRTRCQNQTALVLRRSRSFDTLQVPGLREPASASSH